MTNLFKQLYKGGFSLFLVILMASCSQFEDQADLVDNASLRTIPEVLKSMEQGEDVENSNARKGPGNTFATFNAALGKTGLASVFAKNNLTVFAPTDAAFAKLELNPGNIGNVEGLTNILLYHVVSGSVFSTDLQNGFVPTIQGAAVEISLDGAPKVNNANIVLVDKQARNGVIHGIDEVLFPPTDNIMELVNSNSDFSILKFALEATDLDVIVANTNDLTVFAPTNAAFAALLEEYGYEDLDGLLADVGLDGLEKVLTYHVFAGARVFSSDLANGDIIMFSGDVVTVDVSGPKLIDTQSRASGIIATDIQASNGVVHVIDTVILNVAL